eukprot:14362887-Ditylum_brightwellii.AAC.1
MPEENGGDGCRMLGRLDAVTGISDGDNPSDEVLVVREVDFMLSFVLYCFDESINQHISALYVDKSL